MGRMGIEFLGCSVTTGDGKSTLFVGKELLVLT